MRTCDTADPPPACGANRLGQEVESAWHPES